MSKNRGTTNSISFTLVVNKHSTSRPSFLKQGSCMKIQQKIILLLKEPTSDMALIAQKRAALVYDRSHSED